MKKTKKCKKQKVIEFCMTEKDFKTMMKDLKEAHNTVCSLGKMFYDAWKESSGACKKCKCKGGK